MTTRTSDMTTGTCYMLITDALYFHNGGETALTYACIRRS